MRCEDCKFFVANDPYSIDGECRRRPPSILHADGYTTGYPKRFNDFCGEFISSKRKNYRAREEALNKPTLVDVLEEMTDENA